MSKASREYKRKMEIRKTLQGLKRHVLNLSKQKEMYIAKAKEAKLKGAQSSYSIARSGLKTTLLQLKKTEEMVLNIELISQYKDFAKMSGGFVKNLQGISKELQKEVGKMNFAKAEKLFDSAMNAADMANEQMEGLLNNNSDTFASMSSNADVSDAEIDALIGSEVISEETNIDDKIQSMLNGTKKEEKKTEVIAMNNEVISNNRKPIIPNEVKPNKEDKKEEEEIKPKKLFIKDYPNYLLPSFDLLSDYLEEEQNKTKNEEEAIIDAEKILETLRNFGIVTEISKSTIGPLYTLHEVIPSAGQKTNEIAALENNFKMALQKSISLQIPLPGKNAFGIAVVNKYKTLAGLKDIIRKVEFDDEVKVILGIDIDNNVVSESLYKLPHLLIGGSTGSGKSTFLHSLITSLLLKYSPKQLQLLLIDLKRVEFNSYNGLPQLMTPKAIDNDFDALGALTSLVELMEERYAIFERLRIKNIKEYNQKYPEKQMPFVLTVIDEFADLMVSNLSPQFTKLILSLAQKARASGIHLILATQRPSVDIIKGVIKANFPSQIAFKTANMIDSRTIISDSIGASLFGCGDLVLNLASQAGLQRLQSPFISSDEVDRVVSDIINNNRN